MKGIITTKKSRARIVAIIRRGTKRQRKKYRNTYAVICGDGKYILGRLYRESGRLQDRLDRAERRGGLAYPRYAEGVGIVEPAWHGVKGMVGMFWTWRGDDGVWVGREGH